MNLQKLNLVELDAKEMKETEGGFPPAILVMWGAMLVADGLAVGAYLGYHNNKK
ncbi:TPA: class IIb bacteriocin, lactobin A/cerein 7B family [Elizabethkingia anophelis]|uniref:class IIb bacteriocin, lactobin A/cerein 7B family n=1 Tax=Elizabethkingia anophelis TaxID=1117645 RepID=UPI000B1347DE|nr:class IIb bacteriocin, lactobin A/cerein 7B family [Elizabethkingia anophelis]MCT3675360.1 class IIb bacteriocin, lactobin A/cerein 7B family [Elizabethkingia anophelis]MCT3682798.1 class IIb bacteriocin, lactobin A/cerein 7B family [Elizabethkingia anophelis]MCT3701569.1 class IIb bacteriocin, lactobin A/cerein 7B family [Elizabethkingia anophelis]MCT3727130.1 class IIb bacteriocin, lactobin A/cerein 7B family [Elizabethkingia anophelis]MCT3771605.1 class IIb bacteriocin, lactobin A/cerein